MSTVSGKHPACPLMNKAAYSDSAAEAHTDAEICLHIVSTIPLISSWGELRLFKYWIPPTTDRAPGSRWCDASDCMRSIMSHALILQVTLIASMCTGVVMNKAIFISFSAFISIMFLVGDGCFEC